VGSQVTGRPTCSCALGIPPQKHEVRCTDHHHDPDTRDDGADEWVHIRGRGLDVGERDAVHGIARQQAEDVRLPPRRQEIAEDLGQPEEAKDRSDRAGGAAEDHRERQADNWEEGHHRTEPEHRFRDSGLTDLQMGPQLGTARADPRLDSVRSGFVSGQLATLNAEAAAVWRAAATQAEAEQLLLWASPLHCAVGTKP
jgi:hypothetical protein